MTSKPKSKAKTAKAANPTPSAKSAPVAHAHRRATDGQEIWQARWFHLTMWVVLIALAFLFLDAVKPILLPFVLGGLIAYLMDPLADWLEARRLPRGIVAAGITIALFATVAGLFVWVGPLLYHQLMDLVAKIPTLLREVELSLRDETAPLFRTLSRFNGDGYERIPSNMGELLQRGLSATGTVLGKVLASAANVLNILGLLLITPIVCFYFIRDWSGVLMRCDKLLPRVYAPTIREQLRLINHTLAAYLRGQLTVMLILSVFYSVIFSLIGVKYAVLLGVLAGVLVIIPYLGTWISIALGMMVAYGQFGVSTPFWAMLGIYFIGQILESQILTPKIVGDQVGVHPLWMLFGMLAGAVLFGFVGVLLAVPLTAVISVLVKFVIARYLQSTLYTDA